jgi:hypothetical protein
MSKTTAIVSIIIWGSAAFAQTPVQADLDSKAAALANVQGHETIHRYINDRPQDVIEADVVLVDGCETYAGVRRGGKQYKSVRDIGGAWSAGEFWGVLEAKTWYITVAGKTYDVPHTVAIQSDEGEVTEISWHAGSLPPGTGINSIDWTVTFGSAAVAGQSSPVPLHATYIVRYRGRVDRNETDFSNFHIWGSQTNVTWEIKPLPAAL